MAAIAASRRTSGHRSIRSGRYLSRIQELTCRKIIPAVAAGAAALAVAGATFGYVTLNNDVQLSVDGPASDVTTMAGTVGDVLAEQGDRGRRARRRRPCRWTPGWSTAPGSPCSTAARSPITIDGKPQTFWTTATNVDQALAAPRHRLGRRRPVHQPQRRHRSRGPSFTLTTLKTITIDDAGKKRQVKTTAHTVGAALTAAKITVDGDDKLSTSEDTALTDGGSFSVTRVDVKTVTEKKKVDYETIYKNTDDLDQGDTRVETEGKDGERTIVYTEVRHNGKLESREREELQDQHRRPGPRSCCGGPGNRRRYRSRTEQPSTVTTSDDDTRPRASSDEPRATTTPEHAAARPGGRLGPPGPVRVRPALGHQHGQRLLRRPAVQRPRPGARTGGSGMAHNASREEQIRIAEKVLADVGWGAWPACSRKLGLR